MRIEIKGLNLELGGNPVLRNLDISVSSGSAVAVVGPSGAGKTSLLRTVAGLLAPNAGQVLLDGREPAHYHGSAKLAFLFQEACLCPHLTVRENLELVYWAVRRTPDRAQIDRQLTAVGLNAAAGKYPHECSVGMRARAAIARSLCLPPGILLMDEPFAALDPVRRLELNQAVARHRRERGITLMWVSHDVPEALMFADFILGLDAHGQSHWYDRRGLEAIADVGALPSSARMLRDQIIRETMEGAA